MLIFLILFANWYTISTEFTSVSQEYVLYFIKVLTVHSNSQRGNF